MLRAAIGFIFVVSGFEKLISPYQNFLFVLQSYSFLPSSIEEIVARLFPWIEFLGGIFLVVGIWLKMVLRAVMALLLIFIVVVAQALIRHLPVDECGCFGELISFPLPMILAFDTILFFIIGLFSFRMPQAGHRSLDRYFEQNENA